MKIAFVIFAMLLAVVGRADDPPKPGYSNQSQAAVVQTGGNSTSESYSVKQVSIYVHDKDTGKLFGDYLQTRATDPNTGINSETAMRWDAGIRYERAVSDWWSGYVGYLLESDIFAGFLQRHNFDLGAKYILAKQTSFDLLSEAGYRYIAQNNTDGSHRYSNNGRLFLDGTYRINPTNSARLWMEYLPDLGDGNAWMFNSEASISSTINTIFSLKVAFLYNHNNEPAVPTKVEDDTTLTTALVAKY